MSNVSKMGLALLAPMSCWKAIASIMSAWALAANLPTRASSVMEGSDKPRFTRQQMRHSSHLHTSFIEGPERCGGNPWGLRHLTFPPTPQRLRS